MSLSHFANDLVTRERDVNQSPPRQKRLTLDPFIYDADYCCALVRIGSAIFKCTDRARYGSNVCALHVSHDLIMSVPANAQ